MYEDSRFVKPKEGEAAQSATSPSLKKSATFFAYVSCFGMIKIRAIKQTTLKKFFVTLSEERWPSG
jgi:hypothetical protein